MSIRLELCGLPTGVAAFANALMAAVPLLTEHWPEGMIDFREGVPMAWRSGLMVRPAITDQVPVEQEGMYYFRALFGSAASRNLATSQIGNLLSATGMFTPWPFQSEDGCMQQLSFNLLEEWLHPLTIAIAPAPARERVPWPPQATRDSMEQNITQAFRGRDTTPIDDHLL